MELFTGLPYYGRLLALSTNIRLGGKRMEVANTLAFYDTITAVKSLTVLAPDKMFRVDLRPMLQFFYGNP